MSKGTKNFEHFQEEVYDVKWVVPVSFAVGAIVGLLWLWPFGPYVKKKMEAKKRSDAAAAESTEAEVTTSPPSAAAVHPVESFASIGSIGSSIGSHKERRGAQLAEYDPEQGSIKFAINESVKSLKLTISSESLNDGSSESTEHATNTDDERHKIEKPQTKKKKKKNILVRFEEATYKQNLAEQAMDGYEDNWI